MVVFGNSSAPLNIQREREREREREMEMDGEGEGEGEIPEHYSLLEVGGISKGRHDPLPPQRAANELQLTYDRNDGDANGSLLF